MLKICTQDQAFLPRDLKERFKKVKELGFDGYEIDGSLLLNNLDEVKEAIKETGLPVVSACRGYRRRIKDYIEEKRINGLEDIEKILEALQEIGGKGIVVPAAWGMFTFRLPPMQSPRSLEGDRKAIIDSLKVLDKKAGETNTVVYLEPLNRYQDHMINTLATARSIIEEGGFKNVKIIADVYHMNIDEDEINKAVIDNKDLVRHIHVADNHRFQPGSGSIDFKKFFGTLKDINYDGNLVFECRIRGENPEEEYKKALDYLRGCE